MTILWFILGTILGSFYHVLATRLPQGMDVIKTRSHCDSCNETLKWYNLIPIVSFIVQRGKCSMCGAKITKLHFITELSTGFLFMLLSLIYPFGYELFISLIIASLLIIILISDFLYMIILDSPLVIASILVIILKFIYEPLSSIFLSLLTGVILFLVMFLIEKIGSLILKKDSLGGGDIKLTFVIGLILGFRLGLVSLILSTFLALPYATATLKLNKTHEFAYGPFLIGSSAIVFLFQDKFLNLLDFLFMV